MALGNWANEVFVLSDGLPREKIVGVDAQGQSVFEPVPPTPAATRFINSLNNSSIELAALILGDSEYSLKMYKDDLWLYLGRHGWTNSDYDNTGFLGTLNSCSIELHRPFQLPVKGAKITLESKQDKSKPRIYLHVQKQSSSPESATEPLRRTGTYFLAYWEKEYYTEVDHYPLAVAGIGTYGYEEVQNWNGEIETEFTGVADREKKQLITYIEEWLEADYHSKKLPYDWRDAILHKRYF
jgi:hypothetical protein